MKKKLFILLVILVLIQFVNPTKNNSNNNLKAIATVVDMPTEVKEILKTSCYDCHSNNTHYPWYSNVAPVSWYLAYHVNDGKEHLNFSEWTNYNTNQKKHIIKDLKEVLKDREMPLKSYLIVHKEAVMKPAQFETLLAWVNTIHIEE